MADEIIEETMTLSEKQTQRPRQIPPGRTIPDQSPDAFLNTQSMPVEPELMDNLPEPTPEEENQIDIFLGTLKDFIWDEGYNTIVGKLKKGQDKLPETIGDMAGRMVNKEVKASDSAENSVSRDLLFGIGAEVVNELFEVAANEGLYKKTNEQEQQADQGEALISAVEKYGNMGDPQMNPQGLMKMASSALRGGYPEEELVSKMGMPVLPEMGGANGGLV